MFKRPKPSNNETSPGRKGKLPSLKGVSTDISKNLDNETIFSSDLKSAKKRNKAHEQSNSDVKTRFPKLMNNKSLATEDDTQNTIDQTQDSLLMDNHRTSKANQRHSSQVSDADHLMDESIDNRADRHQI